MRQRSIEATRDLRDGLSGLMQTLHRSGQLLKQGADAAWWHLRTRFYETYKVSIGVEHDREMVISLDPDLTDLRQLKSELAQVLYKLNANGKVVCSTISATHAHTRISDDEQE